MQKLQQFKEMVKDNEKRYAITKQYKVRFDYEEHKNVKTMKPFIKEMVRQIKDHAEEVKLSHYAGMGGRSSREAMSSN